MNETKEDYKLGIKGIIKDFSLNKIFINKYIWISLILSILFTIFTWYNKNLYNNLIEIVNLCISIFPNLLGFVLGSYILIIGFSNLSFLKYSSKQKIDKDNKTTYFRRINSIFVFSILIHSLTLFLSVLIFLLSKLNIYCEYADFFNFIFLLLIVFMLLYSILIIIIMAINCFNFAVVYSLFLKRNEDTEEE